MSDFVHSLMFEGVARRALRQGIRDSGFKIGVSDLDEQAASLAYALAEVANRRIDAVIAELDLPEQPA